MATASAVGVEREFSRPMAMDDFGSVAAVLAPDFVLEWPLSNERIRGAERYARTNREYVGHGRWRFAIVRLFGDAIGAVWEVDVSDGVQRAKAISLCACRNGRIAQLVGPEAFAARAGGAHLVASIEPRTREP
jgi:hypothetical protein